MVGVGELAGMVVVGCRGSLLGKERVTKRFLAGLIVLFLRFSATATVPFENAFAETPVTRLNVVEK